MVYTNREVLFYSMDLFGLYKAVAEVFIWLLHSEKQATIFQKQQEEANNR